MVNFDNSATTFPKPQGVAWSVEQAVSRYGGNPGRGGHKISMEVSNKIYSVRKSIADFFGASVENVAFTANCTFALNMAIKGIMAHGGHIIISEYEHNSVARPVYALTKTNGVEYSIAKIYEDDEQTVSEFAKLIRPNTKCICITAASNVTGRILPYKQLAKLAQSKGICFILDGAQGCGTLDIKIGNGINFICTSGHKGLYGPTGTGLLISDGSFKLATIIEGGTGATSNLLEQTDFLPERLESGTINSVGIIGLGAGLKFVRTKTPKVIFDHEDALCKYFEEQASRIKGIKFYDAQLSKAPIRSFNISGASSEEVATYLNERGFALRGGLHCAALTHNALGTLDGGTVRFAPGAFNTRRQVTMLLNTLQGCAKRMGE